MVFLMSVAISLDPDSAAIALLASSLSPSPTLVSIITENTYLSHLNRFHKRDRVILVSRLRCLAQTIRLGRCVKSDIISSIGHVTHLDHIHRRYIFLDVLFLKLSNDTIMVLYTHICDVDLSFYRCLETILRMQLEGQVHYMPAWIVNKIGFPFILKILQYNASTVVTFFFLSLFTSLFFSLHSSHNIIL